MVPARVQVQVLMPPLSLQPLAVNVRVSGRVDGEVVAVIVSAATSVAVKVTSQM
jgi:hypothetical protein